MVSTPEEARQVVQAMHYPPKGLRSFGQVRNYYGKTGQGRSEPLCLVMIETAQAMNNLDAIAAVDGVDGLFVGPVDLGLGLGQGIVLEEHETVFNAIQQINEAAIKHGKIAASASFNLSYSRQLLEMGTHLIVQGSDLGFIRVGSSQAIKEFKALLEPDS